MNIILVITIIAFALTVGATILALVVKNKKMLAIIPVPYALCFFSLGCYLLGATQWTTIRRGCFVLTGVCIAASAGIFWKVKK